MYEASMKLVPIFHCQVHILSDATALLYFNSYLCSGFINLILVYHTGCFQLLVKDNLIVSQLQESRASTPLH